MKIESKLSLNNMKKNIKRILFTTISVTICTFLILTTLLMISSIKSSILKSTNVEYNDYHFIIKNISLENFDKIKNKTYIDKIYIQETENSPLKNQNEISSFPDKINIYIKYKNVIDTYKYSSNILQTLDYSFITAENNCSFNENLLTTYGLMGANLDYEDSTQSVLVYKNILNLSYIINILIITVLIVFSILSIIILYNAFLIAINERKKQYAILNSIGATEGQILKMIFFETTIITFLGIIIGILLSYIFSHIILNMLNDILISTSLRFELVVDFKYFILALGIILVNIYISSIIPSVKASTSSVIQDIQNSKRIKYKNNNKILKKFFSIEATLALINLKRNGSKYRIITILLTICMTSYILMSTYINYEKEISNLATDYDVDAGLTVNSNTDYKSIFSNYTNTSKNNLKYIEYKLTGLSVLVDSPSAVNSDNLFTNYKDGKKSIQIALVGLDDRTYSEYIKKINAKNGDYILYNVLLNKEGTNEISYTYSTIFNDNALNLSIIDNIYNFEEASYDYKIIDNKSLNREFFLTDEPLDGFKEFKNKYHVPTIFVNMNSYNEIENILNDYISKNEINTLTWINVDVKNPLHIKVICDNIIEFSNYLEDVKEKYNLEILTDYYSLENQEKIIYTNILQLILKILIITIIVIGIISSINIISASLYERKQEFRILSVLGATRKNINKILIYECIYMFIRAILISIILSIPILYLIIKNMEKIIILDKLLIPFSDIILFFIILFVISLFVTLYSSKSIKQVK